MILSVLYNTGARIQVECSFYTWIYRIVTNRCLDYLRRHRNHYEIETLRGGFDGRDKDGVSQVADGRHASDPERGLVTRELRACIRRALEELSPCAGSLS